MLLIYSVINTITKTQIFNTLFPTMPQLVTAGNIKLIFLKRIKITRNIFNTVQDVQNGQQI